jgi:hypothetical protein
VYHFKIHHVTSVDLQPEFFKTKHKNPGALQLKHLAQMVPEGPIATHRPVVMRSVLQGRLVLSPMVGW